MFLLCYTRWIYGCLFRVFPELCFTFDCSFLSVQFQALY
uniref:Uncharacterized protein n=1 Tax=Rhizophora mucronata TaxID=61149 RepID=A0A2P2LL45_RHIMU